MLWGLVVSVVALAAVGLHAAASQPAARQRQALARDWVRQLDLTDAAWFTEARYARHLTQADLHAPFQDGPGALEHFPAGSLLPPPRPQPSAGPAAVAPAVQAGTR